MSEYKPKGLEERAFEVELRASEHGNGRTIIGHAAVFNKLSEDLGGFREKIAPGAFAESIEADDVRALFNHSPDFVLGRNKSGTLRMHEDKKGLRVEIDPPDTQQARDLLTLIDRGDVSQMSFGFVTETDEWDMANREKVVRTLKKVRVFDVSPVTFPAYPQTDVAVRALHEIESREAAKLQTEFDIRRRRLLIAMR